MSSPDYLFNEAKTALDVAVIAQLQDLRARGQLQGQLANSGSELLNTIFTAKDSNAKKVMGDLGRSIDNQKVTYYYYQRNKDLLNLGDIPLKRLETDANAAKHDKELAQRQYEINQWTSGNRADTLFVYQIIFLTVLVLAILTGMWRSGIVSTGFLSLMTTLAIIINVLVIIRRAQYTIFTRDQRYWNKRNFQKFSASQVPIPNCPTMSDIQGLGTNAMNQAQEFGQAALDRATRLFGNATQSTA